MKAVIFMSTASAASASVEYGAAHWIQTNQKLKHNTIYVGKTKFPYKAHKWFFAFANFIFFDAQFLFLDHSVFSVFVFSDSRQHQSMQIFNFASKKLNSHKQKIIWVWNCICLLFLYFCFPDICTQRGLAKRHSPWNSKPPSSTITMRY